FPSRAVRSRRDLRNGVSGAPRPGYRGPSAPRPTAPSAGQPTTRAPPRRMVRRVSDTREISALQAMSDAVLAITAERTVEPVLQRLDAAARVLPRAGPAAR